MKPRKGYKICLKDGCPGCGRVWGAKGSEGQCSRCSRCLMCCGDANVAYTCANKSAKKTIGQQIRSQKAYERWEANPNMLSNNRRIV